MPRKPRIAAIAALLTIAAALLVSWSLSGTTTKAPAHGPRFGVVENETTRAEAAEAAIRAETIKGSRLEKEGIPSTAYAKESVGRSTIANLAVNGEKLETETITGGKLKKETLTSGQYASESLTAAKFQKEAVGKEALANEGVAEEKLKAHAVSLGKLATSVSKQIPAEHGRSGAMTTGEITVTAPAVTSTGAIILTTEGATPIAVSVGERKAGEGFKVKATATSTDQVNWIVFTE